MGTCNRAEVGHPVAIRRPGCAAAAGQSCRLSSCIRCAAARAQSGCTELQVWCLHLTHASVIWHSHHMCLCTHAPCKAAQLACHTAYHRTSGVFAQPDQAKQHLQLVAQGTAHQTLGPPLVYRAGAAVAVPCMTSHLLLLHACHHICVADTPVPTCTCGPTDCIDSQYPPAHHTTLHEDEQMSDD